MNPRPPRRTYTGAALEIWLDRLEPDWEGRFSREAVEAGRALYRQGCIRDIAAGRDELIVSGAWDEQAAHVVFYWREDGLHWRGSLDRPLHVDALAVAGLYAAEELIADCLPALPSDSPPPVAPPAAETSPSPAAAPVAPAPAAASPVAKSPRDPVVVFTLRPDALVFTARWEEPGRPRRPVFGPGAPDAAALLPADRDAVLRLVTLARKAGFVYEQARAAYRFESAEGLPRFVREELPRWRARFRMEGDADLDCLAVGVRELDLGAEISPYEDSGDMPDGVPPGPGAFSLDWRVGLDGVWFEPDTARSLLSRGDGLSIVPGRGLVRLTRRAAATVADWPQASRGGFPPYLLLSLFRDEALKLDAAPALLAWRDALLAPPDDTAAAPDFLRPYQVAGVRWLVRQCERGAHPLLADEMGLGKTVQVLALLLATRPHPLPSLIVCPASVVPVWRGEIEKFFPGASSAVMGRGRRFDETPAPRVWICSYTQLRRHKAQLDAARFGYAVLDEAQFIKNPDAKVTQACLAVHAEQRLALSGTPVENRPSDLWALFRFLMPGLLGRRRGFEDGFAADPRRAAERLRAQVSPFTLRRTKREVARELPEKVEAVLPCPLTDLQREEYRRLVAGGLETYGADPAAGARDTVNFLALLTRLRQAACDPGLLPWRTDASPEQSGKIAVLADKLAEIVEGGGKAVVFSQFTTLLDRVSGLLKTRFPDTPVYELTGESRDRAAPVAGFQKTVGAAIILVSLKAGGTGVTLTAGDYVFLLDPWWNPAVEAQAVDRVHRIGREGAVFVYRMIALDTVEDRIERLKSAKRELFDRVVGDIPDLSDWTAHFPSLASLIALSDDRPADPE